VLRAPVTHSLGERPFTPGRTRWHSPKVEGLRLKFLPSNEAARLTVQVVLRGFGMMPAETTGEASVQVEAGTKELAVTLTKPAQVEGQFAGIPLRLVLMAAQTRVHLRSKTLDPKGVGQLLVAHSAVFLHAVDVRLVIHVQVAVVLDVGLRLVRVRMTEATVALRFLLLVTAKALLLLGQIDRGQ